MSFTTPPPPPPPPPIGGPPTPPPSYPGGFPAQGAPVAGGQLAGAGIRFVSLIVDGLIQALMALPFAAVSVVGFVKALEDCDTIETDTSFEFVCQGDQLKAGWLIVGILSALIGFVVMLYLFARWLGKGATPAMKMFNLRLVDVNTGAPVGTGRAFGRMLFASFISGQICGLGYLWALWDKQRQTWHDKVISSVVVKG
jgi:uncharacterized RDD family membrane protein YckC